MVITPTSNIVERIWIPSVNMAFNLSTAKVEVLEWQLGGPGYVVQG